MGPGKASAFILCCLLGVLCRGKGSSQTENCDAKQQTANHIELCHDRPRLNKAGQHCETGEGFVLKDLMIAPRSRFHDCDDFRVDGFFNAKCLGSRVENVGEFNAAVFDLLDKVSGKNQIDNDTVVDRISFTTTSSLEGEKGREEEKKDSSSFVSFREMCKPVRSTPEKPRMSLLNLCSVGKFTDVSVYLSLDGTALPPTRSLCQCTLTPSNSLEVRALDVRLQHVQNHACQPGVSLKIHSGNMSQELNCNGLSARYGAEKLFRSDKEVTLDLTLPAHTLPSAVWLQVEMEGGIDEPGIVNCQGIRPLDNSYDHGSKGDQSEGTDKGVIIGLVVGVTGVIVVIIVVVVWRKRQNAASTSLQNENGNIYAEINEYAQPGKPTPSSSTPFCFPETDPTTPPPLPDSPPPGAPPVANPVPKPKRTFSFGTDPATNDAANEDKYDHLLESTRGGSAKGDSGQGSGKKRKGISYDHLQLEEKDDKK